MSAGTVDLPVMSPREMAARALARERAKPLAATAAPVGVPLLVRECGDGMAYLVHEATGDVCGVYASAELARGTLNFLRR